MFNMMLASAIFATVIMILVWISFRERLGAAVFKPKQGNSELIAAETAAKKDLPMCQQMRLCALNKAYMFTSLGTSCIIIHMYVFTTLIGQLVLPFGITDVAFITEMGLFVYGFGIIGGVISSIVLMRYPEKMMFSAFLINIVSLLCLAFFFVADR